MMGAVGHAMLPILKRMATPCYHGQPNSLYRMRSSTPCPTPRHKKAPGGEPIFTGLTMIMKMPSGHGSIPKKPSTNSPNSAPSSLINSVLLSLCYRGSKNYSAPKFFTGFASAALIPLKLTVITAIETAATPATT